MFFSVDPGADATLGGMVATGACGTTSVRYGTMRENVLSLTVVTADGEIVAHQVARAQVQRRLRPHAAVHRLRGHARPDHRDHAARPADARGDDRRACAFPTLDAAVDAVIEVLAHAIPVARIELLDDAQIDAVNRHFELGLAVAPTLLLEFHGTPGRDRGAGRGRGGDRRAATARWGSPGPPTRPSAARCGTPATAPTRPRRALRPGAAGLHHRRLRADLQPRREHHRDQADLDGRA